MFKNIQYYQRVILLVWLGVSAGFAQAATDCNQVTEIPVSECQSLLEFYISTRGYSWFKTGGNFGGWNETNTPCNWGGVSCNSGHVISLDFGKNTVDRLEGQLSDLNLPYLQMLIISTHQLAETIPNFSYLSNLWYLDLSGNKLKGEIPNFTNLQNLTVLKLNSNNLEGEIPNFTNLSNLEELNLSSNSLTGNIPNFDNLFNLKYLSLTYNFLTGNIPAFTSFGISKLLVEGGMSGYYGSIFSNNCGLVAYDPTQEIVLNQRDNTWNTRNLNCPSYTVTLVTDGDGFGRVSGQGTYGLGLLVTLEAIASENSDFLGWSDECGSSFKMPPKNLVCTATFLSSYVTPKCTFNIVPISSPLLKATGDTSNFAISSNIEYCVWNAVSSVDWITFSNANGVGIGKIIYFVQANPDTKERIGTILINDQIITVKQAGKTPVAPVAQFTATPEMGLPPLISQLDASSSYDPDGGIIKSYEWFAVKEDDPKITLSASGVNPSLTFNEKGAYLLTLKITDDENQTHETTQKIIANDAYVSFSSINNQDHFRVGEHIKVTLADRVDANRVNRTDLWAGIQFPDGTIFLRTSRNIVNSFITYNPPNEKGQAFIPNVERMNDDFPMLDLILPLGLSGKFIFYAVHVDRENNPFVDAWRSNLAIKEITIE